MSGKNSVRCDAGRPRLGQHGNDVAFRAAVADIERIGADRIVCLGA
jgi:hypothetical protein